MTKLHKQNICAVQMLLVDCKYSLHDDFREHTNYSGRNLPGEGIVLKQT